jgi:tripartite-type tricarboxylate transporter receptor subunit TctC
VQKKTLIISAIAVFLISIILGGCSDIQSIPVTTTSKFPEKPITVIVPFSVGGGLDLTARSLEKLAPKYLGQPLVVINKPGGAGAIGWNELVGSNPDGYTIGITAPDMLLLPLYGSTKYDYPTALSPLAQVSAVPSILVVKADQPWQTLNELIEYAKKHPGELKFGHGGVGSFPHIVSEMFGQTAGISIDQVPFNGAGEVTAALLGGHIQFAFINPIVIKEQLKSGTVRGLAVTGEERIVDPFLEHIPTCKEQGIDLVIKNWFGIAVPKEMPLAVKNKLSEGFKAIINDPEFKKNMVAVGLTIEYLGPEESQFKWLADSQKLSKTLQDSGVLEKIKTQRK